MTEFKVCCCGVWY